MQVVFLTKTFLTENISQFIEILNEFPNEYWQKNHFLVDLEGKWEYSVYLKMPDNTVGGYIIASERSKEVHIHKFMIRSDLRNSGLGKSTFYHFHDFCILKGKESITLKVLKSNVGAIRFYYRMGFKNFDETNDLITLFKSII